MKIRFTIIFGILTIILNQTQADIVWSGEQDVQLSALSPWTASEEWWESIELDLNHDGTIDYQINNYHTIRELYVITYGINETTTTWIGSLGDIIDDTRVFFEENGSLGYWDDINRIGPWVGESGYMGLRFESDNGTHYGWLHMTVGPQNYMTVHDWAYETTPDEGIVAGAIPEPSSGALLMIGSLGLWHLRRVRTCGHQHL